MQVCKTKKVHNASLWSVEREEGIFELKTFPLKQECISDFGSSLDMIQSSWTSDLCHGQCLHFYSNSIFQFISSYKTFVLYKAGLTVIITRLRLPIYRRPQNYPCRKFSAEFRGTFPSRSRFRLLFLTYKTIGGISYY